MAISPDVDGIANRYIASWGLVRPFPAASFSLSLAISSAHGGPAELTRRRPFIDTGRPVAIRRKLPSNLVTYDFGIAFLLL